MSEQTASAAVDLAPWFPGAERRASVRLPSSVRVGYRLLAPRDGAGQARVRNISTLGVGLFVPHVVAPSALMQLDFQSPKGSALRPMLARVVYASAEVGRVVGCAFVKELDDATLRLFHAERVGTTGGDNRRWVRFPCSVETVCHVLDAAPGEQSPARIIDISAGGLGLLLPCEFGAGTLLKLDLEGTAARAAGPVLLRVVRAVARPAGDWFLGCEFADQLGEDEVAALL